LQSPSLGLEAFSRQVHEGALLQSHFIRDPGAVGTFLDGREDIKTLLKKNKRDRPSPPNSRNPNPMREYQNFSEQVGLTGATPKTPKQGQPHPSDKSGSQGKDEYVPAQHVKAVDLGRIPESLLREIGNGVLPPHGGPLNQLHEGGPRRSGQVDIDYNN